MLRFVVAIGLFALVASACQVGGGTPGAGSAASSGPQPSSVAGISISRCEDVPRVSAPADWYRDSPIYVANEQPTEVIRAWADGKPGFEEIWIDRERLGWLTVAFSVDAEARQAELESAFPDVGVVAVGVDWTMNELEELQRRVSEELSPLFPISSGILPTQGVVGIGGLQRRAGAPGDAAGVSDGALARDAERSR